MWRRRLNDVATSYFCPRRGTSLPGKRQYFALEKAKLCSLREQIQMSKIMKKNKDTVLYHTPHSTLLNYLNDSEIDGVRYEL